MARPSKLTGAQWEEIRRKVLDGVPVLQLAKEYGVSEGAIRQKVKKERSGRFPVQKIEEAARKSLENDFNDPVVRKLLEEGGAEDRGLFYSRKADLSEIMLQLSLSAKLHAQNAHKLAAMAQNHFNKLDLNEQLTGETRPILNDAMELTACSNEASKQPLKLFEISARANNSTPPGPRKVILVNEPDV